MAIDDLGAGALTAALHVKILLQRREVRLLGGVAIVLQQQLHTLTQRNMRALQRRGNCCLCRSGQGNGQSGQGQVVFQFLHGCASRCRIRCSIRNLRRSKPPGSSGMLRSHCAWAICFSVNGAALAAAF
ncbi:hypothetical protein GALL_543710 [mine drainage metagenome]|uniref:Uncharacterized protein n=1 Tax=mine drainage metagenome TaxID=410659 RepID=A0A1J5PFQ3_9ZZZZ